MSARSARRPVPALVFLLALAILAVVVWVRVADRDSAADGGSGPATCATAPQLPANAAVTVTVLNAAGRDGLATQVLNSFVTAGFARGNVGNTDASNGIGTITYGPNGALSGLLVSYWFPGATLQTDNRQDTSVTVTVGAGFQTLATPEQAAAALAKAQVSQTPPPPTATTTAAGAATSAAGATTSAAASPAATCTTTPPAPTPTPASATPAAS